MISPLSIDSRRMRLTKGTERKIGRKAGGLHDFFEPVTRCEVTLKGRIRISVPSEQKVVSNESSYQLEAAIHEAFDAAGRCLGDA